MDSDSEQIPLPPKKKFRSAILYDDEEEKDFSDLPYNIVQKIFKYLDFKSIANCAKLCKVFYQVSNDREIYSKINLRYNIDERLLDWCITKLTVIKYLSIEYKVVDNSEEEKDYAKFDESLARLFRKCGNHLIGVHFESCKNENVFSLLLHCPNLEDVSFSRCTSSFSSLLGFQNLIKMRFINSNVSNEIFIETLKNNHNLKTLWLSDNKTNFKMNEICENMAKHNNFIEEVHFCEKKKVRATGIRALARCSKLRVLELIGGPLQCDPEDCFEQLAAGCALLERLTINGWKEVNDDNLMPITHFCTQLKYLNLRGLDITIKFCKEALLSLPLLKKIDVYKCDRIKRSQIRKLQQSFQGIEISPQNCDY